MILDPYPSNSFGFDWIRMHNTSGISMMLILYCVSGAGTEAAPAAGGGQEPPALHLLLQQDVLLSRGEQLLIRSTGS